jgi:hypothetical protein
MFPSCRRLELCSASGLRHRPERRGTLPAHMPRWARAALGSSFWLRARPNCQRQQHHTDRNSRLSPQVPGRGQSEKSGETDEMFSKKETRRRLVPALRFTPIRPHYNPVFRFLSSEPRLEPSSTKSGSAPDHLQLPILILRRLQPFRAHALPFLPPKSARRMEIRLRKGVARPMANSAGPSSVILHMSLNREPTPGHLRR